MNNYLYNAVEDNKVKRAEELLKNGADPNYCHNAGLTMLTWAANNGNVEMCKLLVKHGANIDKKNGFNYPIHRAVYMNKMDVLSFLMEKGADLNVKDLIGDTPLHFAIKKSYDHIVERLLASDKIDLEIKNNEGKTPLELADTDKKISKILKINKSKYEESSRIYDVKKLKFNLVSEKMRVLKMSRIGKEIKEKQSQIAKLDIEIKDLNERLTQAQTYRNQFEEEKIKLAKEQEDLQKEDETQGITTISWNEKTYECPVCLIVPYAPKQIVLCTNGHSMCSPCEENLEICPICQVDLGITVRNFLMEKMLAESGKTINS